MATRIVLAKYARSARRDKVTARAQFREILESLAEDLKGHLIASYRTRGEYDYVVIVRIPDRRARRLRACLQKIRTVYQVRSIALGASSFGAGR